MSKDRIKITQNLAPTAIFVDQGHNSEMLLIASPRNVTAAIGSCLLPWHVFTTIFVQP